MKELVLGTALWGWGISKAEAFEILDTFYDRGHRAVDTANNYPLNGISEDYRSACRILSQWIQERKVNDLKVIYKAGSVSNLNSPDNNLSSTFLVSELEQAIADFGAENLWSLMIHWDNQEADYPSNQFDALFSGLKDLNISFGLSGIKNPRAYLPVFTSVNYDREAPLLVEAKVNPLFDQIPQYVAIGPLAPKFFAYGISVSGLKLNVKDYKSNSYVNLARDKDFHSSLMTEQNQQKIQERLQLHSWCTSLYELGIAMCETDTRLSGYIVGPRNIHQMNSILKIREHIDAQ